MKIRHQREKIGGKKGITKIVSHLTFLQHYTTDAEGRPSRPPEMGKDKIQKSRAAIGPEVICRTRLGNRQIAIECLAAGNYDTRTRSRT